MRTSSIFQASNRRFACRSTFCTLLLALSVCAATVPTGSAAEKPAAKGDKEKYHFFPPAPDDPHLQFLTYYSSEKDLNGGKGGSVMEFITGTPPPNRSLSKPYGAVLKDKIIYVCDTGYGEVIKLNLDTKKISSIDSRGPGGLKVPVNIATDADGLLYVTDSGRDEVIILDKNENLVATLGGKTKMKPRDVVATKDRLYIGDLMNHCVHVYERISRKPMYDIPRPQDMTNITHRLFQPLNLAVDGKGNVYASDLGSDHVQVYDKDGLFVRSIGQYGDNAGEFSRPKGIAVDKENRLYVVDAATQVVQLFDDTGRILMWFGDPRSSNVGLQLPAKVTIDYDHVSLFQKYVAPNFQVEYLVIVTSQYGPRKVSVFGFGHKK